MCVHIVVKKISALPMTTDLLLYEPLRGASAGAAGGLESQHLCSNIRLFLELYLCVVHKNVDIVKNMN